MENLKQLILKVLTGEQSLASARAQAARLGNDLAVIEPELWEIVNEVDQPGAQPPEYELIACTLARDAAHKVTDLRLTALLLAYLARALLMNGYSKSASPLLTESANLCRRLGDRRMFGAVIGLHASVLLEQKNLEEAFELYTEANIISQETNDTAVHASSEFGLGQVEKARKNYVKAKRHLIRALELHRSNGVYYEEFKVLMVLSQVYSADDSQDGDSQRLIYLNQAVAAAQKIALRSSDLIRIFDDIAKINLKHNCLEEAAVALEDGLKLCKELDEIELQGIFAGNLGATYANMGKVRQARQYTEKALEIARSLNDKAGIDSALHNLRGLGEITPQENKDEIATPRQAKGLRRSAGADDAVTEKVVQQIIGDAQAFLAQRHGKAYTPTLPEIDGSSLSPTTVSNTIHRLLDEIEEADSTDPYLAFAITVRAYHWAPDSTEPKLMVSLLQKFAGYSSRANRIEDSIQLYDQAASIAFREKLYNEFLAMATNLATILRQSGQVQRAMSVYEAALDAIQPDTSPELQGMVLLNASTAYADLGMYERSKEVCERAIQLLEGDRANALSLAIAYTNLACALDSKGNLEEAELAFTKTLELVRKEKVESQEGVALGHLGLIKFKQGRYQEAFLYLQRAIELAEKHKDLWNAQHWHSDLANAYSLTRVPDLAREHFQKALEISRKVGDRRSEGKCLLGLSINLKKSDADEALNLLKQAWQIEIETGNRFLAVEIALNIAQAYKAKAIDYEGLIASISSGEYQFHRKEVVNPRPPTQPLSRSRRNGESGTGIKDRDSFEQSKLWLNRALELSMLIEDRAHYRGLMLEQADQQRLEGNLDIALKTLQDMLKSGGIKDQINDVIPYHLMIASIYCDLGQPELALSFYIKAVEGYEAITANLMGSEHRIMFRCDFALSYTRIVDLALKLNRLETAFHFCERSKVGEMRQLWSLRSENPPRIPHFDELMKLVEKDGSTAIIEFFPAPNCIYVFVIAPGLNRDDAVIRIDNLGLLELGRDYWVRQGEAYEAFKSPMGVLDNNLKLRWQAEIENVCNEIGERLLKPIQVRLSKTSTESIIFVPHSFLHCIPLHAAPISATQRWADRYCISYIPSSAVLINRHAQQDNGSIRFAAFADPDGDLSMARVEASLAARHFPNINEIFYGKDASKEKAIEIMQKSNWVHFACHATHTLMDAYGSGISLAGSDISRMNGFLSLYEINRNMHLNGTTVVLSACETGTVSPQLSDEFISLSGGFIAAGADIVLASYWKVNDTCAALLLDQFYEQARGHSKDLPQALREAQLWVRNLTEREVFEYLSNSLETSEKPSSQTNNILKYFERRRDDYYPFSASADWAAFYLTGWKPATLFQ
jgi:Uncharacterized protein conserved in bacteria